MNCDALQGIAFENPLLERMANAQESPGLDSEPGLFICAEERRIALKNRPFASKFTERQP